MFPIPFNFPFRKKDGSLTTISDAISSGGSSYTLPTASANTKGGVKVGSGLTMDGETLKADGYTLPTASDETLGGVKVGSGLSIDENGILSASGGGGGGSLYLHNIEVDAGTAGGVAFSITTSSNTPFTYDSLRALTYNNNDPFWLNGTHLKGNTVYNRIQGLSSQHGGLKLQGPSANASVNSSNCTVTDFVIAI